MLAQEENTSTVRETSQYNALLDRLNHASITKHFDAYKDVAWDDPEYAIDLEDPRWIIHSANPLGATEWYQSQPEGVQARIGVHMTATFMKIGWQFESVLQRGLLEFAMSLPNGAREFRYAYHEVIEEAHHSLMFQEFVNRTGLDIPGLPQTIRFASRRVAAFGRSFPELFFLFVLGGEDPIDYEQRNFILNCKEERHPLLNRISQIHVTEEARHLSFARAYLRRNVPKLGMIKRNFLRLRTPLILGNMSRFMMEPSTQIINTYGIPKAVLREAYGDNPEHRRRVEAALGKVRDLCIELGIFARPFDQIWYRMGIAPAKS